MKSSYPRCDRAGSLVPHRRWFGTELRAAAPAKPAPSATDARLFAWLLAPQNAPRLVPVPVRARAR